MDTSASGARLALERRQARAVHKLRRYLAISKLAQISAGELPIRGAGRTALHLADIHTAADVLRRPASAIYGIPQVGWLSLLEFMRLFQRHGANFVWWQERPARLPDRLLIPNPVASSDPVRVLTSCNGGFQPQRSGCWTIGDLLSKNAAELGDLKGFGPTGFFNLMEVCEHSGLEIKPL